MSIFEYAGILGVILLWVVVTSGPNVYIESELGNMSVHDYSCVHGSLTFKKMYNGDPVSHVLNQDGSNVKCSGRLIKVKRK